MKMGETIPIKYISICPDFFETFRGIISLLDCCTLLIIGVSVCRFIHNKDVASSLLVVNESRLLRSVTAASLPVIDQKITIRYKDVDKVAVIQEECTRWMKAHPDMLPGATCKCALQGFDLHGAVMSVKATLKREAAPRKARVVTDILLYIEKTVRKHGAYLATKDIDVALPPALTEAEAVFE